MAIRTSDVDIENDGTYNQYGDINVYSSRSIEKKKPFTNKDLVIPFTLSKANGAQGGTYVPRDDLLIKIEEYFKTERIVFLSGMGGCGKSELARAYGYKHHDDYDEIFWLTCDDGSIPDLMHLMKKADLLYNIEKSDMIDFSCKNLIIVDNCNRETPAFLEELENSTGNAHILVTTRLRNMARFKAILPVGSDIPELFTYSVFEHNYCLEPEFREAQKEIQYYEKYYVYEICRSVQYNTMFVALIGICLREYDDLSIMECASRVKKGVGKIQGEIDYGKDQDVQSGEIREILRFLFRDILKYKFNDAQKRVLVLLSLNPAKWHTVDSICPLLDGVKHGNTHRRAIKSLLKLGWLQGNMERIEMHPLISEVLLDHPNMRQDSKLYESLLENYLGLSEDDLKKLELSYIITTVLSLADSSKPEVLLSVALLLSLDKYKFLFAETHPGVNVAYFVYVTINGYRYFMYRNLETNETKTIAEVPCQEKNNKSAKFLKLYNKGVPYNLNLNVLFKEKRIEPIPSGLFARDTFLATCVLPEEILAIRDYEFYGCRGLIELRFPNNLISIGNYAFSGCHGLSGELRLPKTLTKLGSFAFHGCSGLKGELRLPEMLTNIEFCSFKDCSGFNGNLHLPDNLICIGFGAFKDCSGLNGELHLPDSLTSIGDSAFSGCCNLSGELHLPKNLTSIGGEAFYRCNRIERVVFHNPSTKIRGTLMAYSSAVIVGYKHSTAETYALEHGLIFEELEA